MTHTCGRQDPYYWSIGTIKTCDQCLATAMVRTNNGWTPEKLAMILTSMRVFSTSFVLDHRIPSALPDRERVQHVGRRLGMTFTMPIFPESVERDLLDMIRRYVDELATESTRSAAMSALEKLHRDLDERVAKAFFTTSIPVRSFAECEREEHLALVTTEVEQLRDENRLLKARVAELIAACDRLEAAGSAYCERALHAEQRLASLGLKVPGSDA